MSSKFKQNIFNELKNKLIEIRSKTINFNNSYAYKIIEGILKDKQDIFIKLENAKIKTIVNEKTIEERECNKLLFNKQLIESILIKNE